MLEILAWLAFALVAGFAVAAVLVGTVGRRC